MKNNHGFTLVELMIAVGLLGILGLSVMHFFQGASVETNKIQKKISITQNVSILEKYLSNVVASGSIRFFSFNSDGSKVRSIYPLPERCGDLSFDPTCRQDTSLLYVRYPKTTTAAVSTICRLGGSSLSNNDYLIDLNNTTYGQGTFNSSGPNSTFNISGSVDPNLFPAGPVEVGVDKIIALFSPPYAFLYQINILPQIFNVAQDASTGAFNNSELTPECVKYLQLDHITNNIKFYKLDKLYRLKLIPLFISNLSAAQSAPLANGNYISSKEYPMRTFNVSFETFGKIYLNNQWVLSISRCVFLGSKLRCSTPVISQLSGAQRVRIDENFKIPLINASGNLESLGASYEIISNNQTPTCSAGASCPFLPLFVNNIDNIPYILSGSESSDHLLSANFSFIKQIEIKSIRFRYLTTNSKKEGSFYVFLP